MKMAPLLMLSFLIVFVLPANANPLFEAALEPVRDVQGEELKAGVDYYIVSTGSRGLHAEVTLGPNRKGTICPRDVVLIGPIGRGLPVTFSPVNVNNGVIRVQTDLNIEFSGFDAYCRRRNMWKLDDFDEILGRYFVTTTSPAPEMVNTWFRIEKLDWAYKLVFCPPVCETCKVVCGDVGVLSDDNGVRRLALSPTGDNQPYGITFRKA